MRLDRGSGLLGDHVYCVYSVDAKILLGCFCSIQDHHESIPIQNDGVIHAKASVKLDAIFVVIESK